VARLPLNIIQCLYSKLEQLVLLPSPGDFSFITFLSRESWNCIMYWRPSYRFPEHGSRQGGRSVSMRSSRPAKRQRSNLYNALPHHGQLNSTQYVLLPALRDQTLLALDTAVKALRYTTYILIPRSACKSVYWHHFCTESGPLTRHG